MGGLKKSGDLERVLGLDRTLAWQLIKLSEHDAPLENAANIPSRTSLDRFVAAAHTLGVDSELTDPLIATHDRFEALVERHAGDRVCFNSMVSAAVKGDGWHSAELQHRRNVFRSMSHMLGVQAATQIRCGIVRQTPGDQSTVELLLIGGFVDLRLLWEIERVNVFQSRTYATGQDASTYRKHIRRSNILGKENLNGYLLSDYCTPEDPKIEIVHGDAGWIYGNLLNGSVGATGESTLVFGARYQNIPSPIGKEGEFGAKTFIDLPVKVYIADMLIEPGLATAWTPGVEVLIGSSSGDNPSAPGIERSLPNRLTFERLGNGPCPVKEYPDYPQLVRHVAQQASIDINHFETWRLRTDYPLYGSTLVSHLTEPNSSYSHD